MICNKKLGKNKVIAAVHWMYWILYYVYNKTYIAAEWTEE